MAGNNSKIILGIDDSEHSERAFQFYMDNIHKEDNELLLVHAMEYPYVPTSIVGGEYISNESYDKMFQGVHESAGRITKKFEDRCKTADLKYTLFKSFANPGEYMVKIAQDSNAKMIIMGTRGMGAIRRTILGSVSDYVVHHAHCPVLIARH